MSRIEHQVDNYKLTHVTSLMIKKHHSLDWWLRKIKDECMSMMKNHNLELHECRFSITSNSDDERMIIQLHRRKDRKQFKKEIQALKDKKSQTERKERELYRRLKLKYGND